MYQLKTKRHFDNFSLTLPTNLRVTDLQWLSVWCRAFKKNFGDIFFPVALPKIDQGGEEPLPEPLPEPTIIYNKFVPALPKLDEGEDPFPEEPIAEPEAILTSVLGIFKKIIG